MTLSKLARPITHSLKIRSQKSLILLSVGQKRMDVNELDTCAINKNFPKLPQMSIFSNMEKIPAFFNRAMKNSPNMPQMSHFFKCTKNTCIFKYNINLITKCLSEKGNFGIPTIVCNFLKYPTPYFYSNP